MIINYWNMQNYMAFFNTNDIGIELLRDKIGNLAATRIQQYIRNRSSLKHLKRQFIIILMTLTESQYNYVKEQKLKKHSNIIELIIKKESWKIYLLLVRNQKEENQTNHQQWSKL